MDIHLFQGGIRGKMMRNKSKTLHVESYPIKAFISFILTIILLLFLLPAQPAAAKWAYRFVVFLGDIYEVTDEIVLSNDVDKKIGQVTRFSDLEGTYAGNFSNTFPKGTEYYLIRNKDPKEVIAIKTNENTYLKAINKGHYDNDHLDTRNRNWALIIGALLITILTIWIRVRKTP